MPYDMQVAIKRGMDLLDERAQGWREHLNVESLDMSNVHDCVLGQEYGNYYIGCRILFEPLDETSFDYYREARGHGFIIDGLDEDVSLDVLRVRSGVLTDAWKEALTPVEQSATTSKHAFVTA